MKKITSITEDISKIRISLIKGEVAAIPTETVYGLAANALKPEAVLKIYEIKERPKFNPLILHLADTNELDKYAEEIPEYVKKLINKFSPGPLTYVLKKKNIIPDIVTAGLGTVAVRFPSHPVTLKLLKSLNFPIAAPSANRSGKISPTESGQVLKELSGRIEFILEGGQCELGLESTVIDCTTNKIILLRNGIITKEEIEKASRKKVYEKSEIKKINSPGQMSSHYAPESPLYLMNDKEIDPLSFNSTVGYLDFSKYKNVKEIAKNLFKDLQTLDDKHVSYIIARKVKNEGIGLAINDRLERAASGYITTHKTRIKIVPKM
ncbi:MAG TPA: L-threonylcarbamoyladenylate synthase [Ignavibacteria bacterium]|nr:L-threonylcarbamoyladenylate synthase [Ignavibacteria bacterium]